MYKPDKTLPANAAIQIIERGMEFTESRSFFSSHAKVDLVDFYLFIDAAYSLASQYEKVKGKKGGGV